jgi:hypothetical protein
MPRGTGAGSIFKRGRIWWCCVHVDGRPVDESSKSTDYEVAKRHLAKMNGKKVRDELGGVNAKMTVRSVLDHYLELCQYRVEPNTRKIYQYTIEANIAPFFGAMRADRLTTDHLLNTGGSAALTGRSSRQLTVNWWFCERPYGSLRTPVRR